MLDRHADGKEDWGYSVSYITDAAVAADLAVRVIERMEIEAAKRAENEAERTGVDPSQADDDLSLAERVKAARKAERDGRRKAAEAARTHNLKLGRALLTR